MSAVLAKNLQLPVGCLEKIHIITTVVFHYLSSTMLVGSRYEVGQQADSVSLLANELGWLDVFGPLS